VGAGHNALTAHALWTKTSETFLHFRKILKDCKLIASSYIVNWQISTKQ